MFRCYLYDILPLTEAEKENKEKDKKKRNTTTTLKTCITWPTLACKFFLNLIKDRVFTGYVFERSTEHVTKGQPDFLSTYGMVLHEEIPNFKQRKRDMCTVNARMVDAGWAKPIGILYV